MKEKAWWKKSLKRRTSDIIGELRQAQSWYVNTYIRLQLTQYFSIDCIMSACLPAYDTLPAFGLKSYVSTQYLFITCPPNLDFFNKLNKKIGRDQLISPVMASSQVHIRQFISLCGFGSVCVCQAHAASANLFQSIFF